jgi:hypothetical protein
MSQINPRNYQLGLAFNDADLRKPDHDKIMMWLSDWVKEPANLRRFLPTTYSRSVIYQNRFDETANAIWPTLTYHEQQVLRDDLERLPREPGRDYDGTWADEPLFRAELTKSTWERMLKGDRGSLLGFCDLHCVYEIWHYLSKVTIQRHQICPEDKHGFTLRKWKIVKTDVTEDVYQTGSNEYQIYFEVKSEIRSIGELIRQLQLYRSSATFQGSLPGAQMIVVAPPNNSAAAVCKENGFEFLEYRPF